MNTDGNTTVNGLIFLHCKKKCHIYFSESYQKLVSLLEDSALNYLTLLQTSSEVTRSCSFKTLSPDVTRFLIKQREKFLKDHDVEGSDIISKTYQQ